jgi:hypothetical protein
MTKIFHEIRDPIHVFIRLDAAEREVLDSRPFQRLRHIHQLAMTYLIYPGATHKRFEHSLGVMELASKVYDIVTHPDNVDAVKELLPEVKHEDERRYWRRVVRMAALCHDLGHLPFSHAAEKELLPKGWDHERLTKELIQSQEMKAIWDEQRPPLNHQHIIKLAVGPSKYTRIVELEGVTKDLRKSEFSNWEKILAEIIVGDWFGVDRIDYLLRDAYHAGVAYGKFDHHRLIDTLRILPGEEEESIEPALGVEEGGLQSVEALLLARYWMYSQVYFHPVRRSYNIHLQEFLKDWLKEQPDWQGKFPTDVEGHLSLTDNEVTTVIRKASVDEKFAGHQHAKRIMERKHFKVLYSHNPDDTQKNPRAVELVYQAAKQRFGEEQIWMDKYGTANRDTPAEFPVLTRDNRIASSLSLSDVLRNLPPLKVNYVFIEPSLRDKAVDWLNRERANLLKGE